MSVVEGKLLSVTRFILFRDDDAGYLAWLTAHPEGYVVNISRSHNTPQARLHHASCRTIHNQTLVGSMWTGPYVKVCSEHLADIEQWATETLGQPIAPCGICGPSRGDTQAARAGQPEQAVETPTLKGCYEIHGPNADSPMVQAWADDYIRFERRPVWQEQLRNEIRRRCGQLVAASDQVLHARFFGRKHLNADVENLALYYIDSFKIPGRNGIRFEYGAAVPPALTGREYPFCYQYELAPRSAPFAQWQTGRTLASFDWTDLGGFVGDKKLPQVWLALVRGPVELTDQACPPETPFAVRVQLRPPRGRTPVFGNLLKGVFDGVISAFQAHTDTAVLPEAVARIATMIPAGAAEIEKHLLDQRRAVLGVSPRLVSPYREGVKWDPVDHRCVAGELVAADPAGTNWEIKGELIEVNRLTMAACSL
ncbi:hypothetical protein GAN17_06805 [Mycobacterium kubicae]|uniref:hypothetical protein n=1 Tax=Mycobacterium kubicae TaxID=120959 RepID=UPI0016421EEB|nr:hypothetical protein [Mycobacterium kubicae]QNI06033.1 hypothetical protein GAN17_06805 [Mycobacterium kubicae]